MITATTPLDQQRTGTATTEQQLSLELRLQYIIYLQIELQIVASWNKGNFDKPRPTNKKKYMRGFREVTLPVKDKVSSTKPGRTGSSGFPGPASWSRPCLAYSTKDKPVKNAQTSWKTTTAAASLFP